MKIGFIGAGKVGCSLGKYFTVHGIPVTGYHSKNPESAAWAAEFTSTKSYNKLEELVRESDIIFLTVPDGIIQTVWNQIREFPLQQKIICHCSGCYSATIFSEINHKEAYGYSVHPLFAISSREMSYKEFSRIMFTIEGSPERMKEVENLFHQCGNQTRTITAENKTLYHATAAVASNLMVGLVSLCCDMFSDCGFSEEESLEALTPILRGNLDHILTDGLKAALTGPVERNDLATVEKHLGVLKGDDERIYRLLSRRITKIAEQKNPERNYEKMEALLK